MLEILLAMFVVRGLPTFKIIASVCVLSFSFLQILLRFLLPRTYCLCPSTISEIKEYWTSHYITWLLCGHWQLKGGPLRCLFLPLHCQTLELFTFSHLPKHLWISHFQKTDLLLPQKLFNYSLFPYFSINAVLLFKTWPRWGRFSPWLKSST